MPLNFFFLNWIISRVSSFIPLELKCLEILSVKLINAFAKTLLFSRIILQIVFTLLWKRIQLPTFKSYFLTALCILYQETLGVLVPLYFVVALKVWRKKGKDHHEVVFNIASEIFSVYNVPNCSFLWSCVFAVV